VALGRIGTLYTVAKKIARSEAPDKEAILRILKKCKRVIRKFWVFDLNNLYYSEMTKPIGVAIELIKIATLMEVKATYRVCNEFNHYRDDLLQVYIYIGRLDAAISVGSYRRSLPYWCTPGLHTKRNYLKFEDVYHPLLKNGIANNLCNTGERSLFINGTNMSGKTTFMRTIGVNVLLARSIRTCLAKQAELSLLNVYSSIRIEDDVESGISYYFQELLRLREFVQTADQSKDDSLFLIDEILKGTNIYDRTKIARSILSYLTSPVHSMVIVTSHDIDLANQLRDIFDFYYFTETVNDTGMQFDYKIRKGLSTERNAVKLLSMLDFPKEIISKTK
jgi:DNA mismatch repair ATPase MutS